MAPIQPPNWWVSGIFPECKAAEGETPSSAQIKNEWSYTSNTPVWHQGMNKGSITFLCQAV
jgi:hypothetical protein